MKKFIPVIVVIAFAAALGGWLMGHLNNQSATKQAGQISQTGTARPAPAPTTNQSATNANASVKALVSYTLPNAWQESSCPSNDSVYIAPPNSTVNCNAELPAPVTISVDASGATDCNQLQGEKNVSKHVCISEFINGHKSLKAETVYNEASSYKKATTEQSYYINTGKGIVKLVYIHDPNNNDYELGFEHLAKSVQVK